MNTRIVTLAALLASTVVVAAQPDALESLVAAERAFARMSVEKGQVQAFRANFADDGIGFQPAPVKMREVLKQAPAQSVPLPVLDWEPWVGDVAATGELGYTTGPWVRQPAAPSTGATRHGWYFSVWKRSSGGAWRVVADIGISSPSAGDLRPHAFEHPAAAPGPAAPKAIPRQQARDALTAAERALSLHAAQASVAEAYGRRAADHIRLHRDGLAPLVGRQAVTAYLARQVTKGVWSALFADASEAGDLGYVYGAYELEPAAAGGQNVRGYYLRVWTRTQAEWQIAADVANAVPQKQ